MKTFNHTCKHCGKEFISNFYNSHFCSKECKKNFYANLGKKQRFEQKKPIYCLYCGEPLPMTKKSSTKYCEKHKDWKDRLLKTYNTCIICGKKFHPTEARPKAKLCSRYCQGIYVQNQVCDFKWDKEELKTLIINYYKKNGYVNSNKIIKDLHISHNSLKRNNLFLLSLAKEAGLNPITKSTSMFEDDVYTILKDSFPNLSIQRQYRTNLCKDKLPLPFDFFIKEYNLYIEADGAQHYRKNSINKPYFDSTLKHDTIKNKFCIDNKFYLLRIRYRRIIQKEKLVNAIKELLLQIERSEANHLNCWNGSKWIQISSQASYIDEGSTTISKESTSK